MCLLDVLACVCVCMCVCILCDALAVRFSSCAPLYPSCAVPAAAARRATCTCTCVTMCAVLEEEFEDEFVMPDAATKSIRSFERTYFRLPAPNGAGFIYCYEIRWADGSTRVVHGVPARLALLAGVR